MTPLESSGRPSPGGRSLWSAALLLTALAGTVALLAGVLDTALPDWALGALAAVAAGVSLALLAVLQRRQRAAWGALGLREWEFERQIRSYQQQLAERDSRLAERETQLAERDTQLAERDTQLAERDTQLAERDTRLAERETQLAEREKQWMERETQWRDRAQARSAAVDSALEHLLRVRLPAVLAGSPVPSAPSDPLVADHTTGLIDDILAEATSALKRSDEREESLRLAVVALSRRVQTAAHSIQEQVSLMAERHQDNPDVVESSMRVDHAAAQQARHAQSLAVLCGEWPGQQWQEPLAMVDVVRAASARILAYQRVEVSGDQDVAVAAEVVEPVIHLVAELLANATQSSPPATTVPVTVRRVQRGAVIEIDDGGIGMDDHRLEQARETVSGRRPVGLAELGEIPQTGLAVVGHYVRRHGFRADLSESPYGGLRAVVLIPSKVVETVDPPEAVAMRRPAPVVAEPPAARPESGPRPVEVEDPDPAAGTTLPRRRSRRGEAAPAGPVAAEPAVPASEPTPEQAASWMGAFISGARTGGEPGPEGSR